MVQSLSQYLTTQFYTWEYRGQGWHLEDVPILLEPPYMPYIRHTPALSFIDDGKRHTLVSKALERLRGKEEVKQEDIPVLDYEQLEKIKQKCKTGITDFEKKPILFFTPDALFSFLDDSGKDQNPDEANMKGYRVNVTYDAITKEEMDRKRAFVANVIFNTMKKHRKKVK